MTSVAKGGARHAPFETIEAYLRQGLDGVIGIDGTPPGQIVIRKATLAVRFPTGQRIPDLATFRNITFDLIHDNGVMWHELRVHIEDNAEEIYLLLCSVLDRVQLAGAAFADAIEEVLNSLSEILATRGRLSMEQQLGVCGELLVIVALTESLGAEGALAAWRGPRGEEHDFAVQASDLEVKTTLGERRTHWISSTTQLVPTGSRSLYLVSIQLTTSGASDGWSLPSLVAAARAVLGGHAAHLDRQLELVGYWERDSDLYVSRWTLRTLPAFFAVDAGFPALTQARLERVVPAPERITDVRYRIDLTALAESPPLFPFAGSLNHIGGQ